MEEMDSEITDTPTSLQEVKITVDPNQVIADSPEILTEIENQKLSKSEEEKKEVEPRNEDIGKSSPTNQAQTELTPKENQEIALKEEDKQQEGVTQPVEQITNEEENGVQIGLSTKNKPSDEIVSAPIQPLQSMQQEKPQEEVKQKEIFNGFKMQPSSCLGSHFLDEILKESFSNTQKAQVESKMEEPQEHLETGADEEPKKEEFLENQKVEDNKQDAQTEHEKKDYESIAEKAKQEETKLLASRAETIPDVLQEDVHLKQIGYDGREELSKSLDLKNEDQEVRLKEQKTDLSDIEDFNLSQLQIKDNYFDDNLEEHLDKKISSAQKEFFEISESDRDLHQYGDFKGLDDDLVEPTECPEKQKYAIVRETDDVVAKEKVDQKEEHVLSLSENKPETNAEDMEEESKEILQKVDENVDVKKIEHEGAEDTQNINAQVLPPNEVNQN